MPLPQLVSALARRVTTTAACAALVATTLTVAAPADTPERDYASEVSASSGTTRTGSAVTNPGTHQRRSVLILVRSGKKFVPNCSGSMVSDRLVLTAAHCVKKKATMRLVPGAHRRAKAKTFARPYGTCRVRAAKYDLRGKSHPTWETDYALLSIGRCTKGSKNPTATRYVGNLTGAWPLANTPNRWWNKGENRLYVASYPGDKAAGTMWHSKHYTIDNIYGHSGLTTGELAGGASGAPMVSEDENGHMSIIGLARATYPPHYEDDVVDVGKTGGVQVQRMTNRVQEDLATWATQMP